MNEYTQVRLQAQFDPKAGYYERLGRYMSNSSIKPGRKALRYFDELWNAEEGDRRAAWEAKLLAAQFEADRLKRKKLVFKDFDDISRRADEDINKMYDDAGYMFQDDGQGGGTWVQTPKTTLPALVPVTQPKIRSNEYWDSEATRIMGEEGKTMDDVRKFQEWAIQLNYDVGGGGIADGKLGNKTHDLWNRLKDTYLNPNTVWNFGTHKWEGSSNTTQKPTQPTQPSTTLNPVQTSPGVQTWLNFVKDALNLWSPYAVSSMFDAPIFEVKSQLSPVLLSSQSKSVPVSTPKLTVKSEAAPTTSPVTTTPQFKFLGDTNYPNEINMNNAVRAQYSDFLKKNNLTELQYPYSQALQIAKNNYLSGKYMLDKNKNKTRVAFFSPSFIRKDVYTE